MPPSPLSSSPYELFGVASTVSHDELRKAFRRALRTTHPDTGGDPARFHAVQLAWEQVSTPERRALYDSGRGARHEPQTFAAQPARARRDTRPRARTHGHPGGWRRERYLELVREWAGRGATLDDPYDPQLVRTAPRELRHLLADALAEEATARTLAELGIGYTVWHDVATDIPERKIDHLVLGPTGFWALLSEDYGGPVRVKRGELIGEALHGERPVHELASRAKTLTRRVRVKVTGLAIVLPDDALDESFVALGSTRGAGTLAVRQSYLGGVLRAGLPDVRTVGGQELFDLRTRLQAGIEFV